MVEVSCIIRKIYNVASMVNRWDATCFNIAKKHTRDSTCSGKVQSTVYNFTKISHLSRRSFVIRWVMFFAILVIHSKTINKIIIDGMLNNFRHRHHHWCLAIVWRYIIWINCDTFVRSRLILWLVFSTDRSHSTILPIATRRSEGSGGKTFSANFIAHNVFAITHLIQ